MTSSNSVVEPGVAVAGWTGRLQRLGIIALVLAGIGAGVWLAREPLLRGAADFWIVSDEVTQADVAAVLGGQIDVRPVRAADLYHKGLIKKILVSNNREGRAAEIGAVQGDTEANRRVLLKLGVPENAIETFERANEST